MMSEQSIVGKWQTWSPYLQSVLRVVAALIFFFSGTMKLFAFPIAVMPDGSTVSWLSQTGIGALLEVAGGALMLVGFLTRPVAFVLSGEMAVAYFQFHAPLGFWPHLNGGIPAIVYCFIWLYFSSAGAGAWSLDAVLRERRQ